MPKPVVALLIAVLAAVALAACGGGSSSSEASSTSATQHSTGETGASNGDKSQPTSKEKGGKSGQPKGGSDGSGGSTHPAAVPPLKVSGGGSTQVRVKGGDNSIQNYGEEDESELQGAAEALHGFYLARTEEDWGKACSYLANSMVKQFEELASRSPQLKGKGCPAILHAFTRPLPASMERETTLIDAISLRREGERAFLIYRGAEHKVYAVPMVQEGGAWKVGGLAGTPLD